ncbi:FxSxx-COOH system tetratricopeptide repeat protein [Kitasatospora sp. NPDC057223]|uniref:FxSxx-COOH system tetratricopeptide repeat protein n=1 Tax=Kitasatospora sp. NPDC057223 TaxID=3346055 RepID=UPI003632335D
MGPNKSAEIITFYSYKGGTGRTMALANVAWILASSGKSVLVVDWDLEAPGLHRYFHPFLLDKELKSTSGVLDMLWEFAFAATDSRPAAKDWHRPYADVSRHAVSIRWNFPNKGSVDLLGAGRQNKAFGQRVNSFDWNSFYNRFGGGSFIESMKSSMRERYDYVLVDSRTGLSDASGICTVQIPDTLVACFTMSTQSISGCAAVVDSVLNQRADGDDNFRVLPVPMRVEAGETDRLEASRDWAHWRFAKAISLSSITDSEEYWGDVEIPYRTLYAYEEMLSPVGDRPHQEDTLLSAFERLTSRITRGAVRRCVPIESQQRRALRQQYRQRPSGRARHDFYLSFSDEDKVWADWVCQELRSAGYRVSSDFDLSHPADWAILNSNAASEGVGVISLLSPDYFQDERLLANFYLAAEGQRIERNRGVAVRVSQFNLAGQLRVPYDVDVSGLSGDEARRRLVEAVRSVYGEPKVSTPDLVEDRRVFDYPDAKPGMWNVPERGSHFVGREDELLLLLRHFREQSHTFAVSGMAGSGKTALAVEFAHRARSMYDVVWYGHVPESGSVESQPSTLVDALEAYNEARHHGLSRNSGLPTSRPRTLVIIDDVEEAVLTESTKRSLSNIHVLVISRCEPTGFANHLRLSTLSSAEAVALLHRYSPEIAAQVANQLAVRVGNLPLALEMVGVQLSRHGSSPADLLTLLDNRMDEIILRAHGDSGRSLIARFERDFERLIAQDASSAQLLSLLVVASPVPIPANLLSTAPDVFSPPMRDSLASDDDTWRIARVLLGRNLAEEYGGSLRVHPVIAAVVSSIIPHEEQTVLAGEISAMLVANDPGDPNDPACWPVYRALMSLASTITWPTDAKFRELVLRLCLFQLASGNPLTAKDFAQRAVKRFEMMLGSTHEDTLGALHASALCDWELGNLQQAEATFRHVLQGRDHLLGPLHPATMAARNNVAALLAATGDWAASVELHEQILVDRRRVLGEEHPDTIISEGNLASSLFGAERYQEALALELSVFDKRTRIFGNTHPATLASAENVADLLEELRRYDEALELRENIWLARTEALGDQHPDALRCAVHLARTLTMVGRYGEARNIVSVIHDDLLRVFGADHQLCQEASAIIFGDPRRQ